MPAEAFAARCVRPAQRFLSYLALSGRLGAARLEVMMVGVLLDVMRQANDDGGGIIPYTEFYNEVRGREQIWLRLSFAVRPRRWVPIRPRSTGPGSCLWDLVSQSRLLPI